ncbi:uncharacterized protein LOC111707715 [Eurytemora carolleeae]|uniref:uncharacterized protein LOC111707715 n=1 Tax=Eurytemora carolleeae TaxID=1294199 RepID=UPI000C794A85|nr:uncharacterized protein LOC111707715 [Eurytemora carolleeae]|eukprot:XP_023336627.1 uncharacterized protein LOC111707715 [Eurytemora affinis]
MFEFRIFVQFYLALSTSNIHSIMEKNFDRSSVCCCCWEYFGLRSKHLTPVNSAIGKTVQTFIYPGYLVDVCSYPSMVCSGCRRNLNLLKAGKQSRGAWGEKVAKVEWKMLTRTSSSSLIQQSPEPTVQASLESSLCS